MDKPRVTFLGQDGNVFNLMAIAGKAMKEAGQIAQVKEMNDKVFNCKNYDEALQIMMGYVEVE